MFNTMLGGIETRDKELQNWGASLEKEVENRTIELIQSNQHLVKAKDAAEVANKAKSGFLANISC